jgi:hypothetical protein
MTLMTTGAEMMPRMGRFGKEAAAHRFWCVRLNFDDFSVIMRSCQAVRVANRRRSQFELRIDRNGSSNDESMAIAVRVENCHGNDPLLLKETQEMRQDALASCGEMYSDYGIPLKK